MGKANWDPVEELASVRDTIALLKQRETEVRAMFLTAEAAVSHIDKFHRVEATRQNRRQFHKDLLPWSTLNDARFWHNSVVEVVKIAPLAGMPDRPADLAQNRK